MNSRIYGGIKNPAEDYAPPPLTPVDGALSACYSCSRYLRLLFPRPPVRARSAAEWWRAGKGLAIPGIFPAFCPIGGVNRRHPEPPPRGRRYVGQEFKKKNPI